MQSEMEGLPHSSELGLQKEGCCPGPAQPWSGHQTPRDSLCLPPEATAALPPFDGGRGPAVQSGRRDPRRRPGRCTPQSHLGVAFGS